MADLVKALEWDRFSVIAHSMGTGVASILVCLTTKIEKMVFIDGMGAPFTIKKLNSPIHVQRAYRLRKMAERVQIDGFSDPGKAMFSRIDEAITNRMNGIGGKISFDASRMLVARGVKSVEGGYRWQHDPRLTLPEYMQLSHEQAMDFLSSINVPLCLVLGDGGLFTDERFAEKSKFLPEGCVVYWVEGGHHFHLEQSAYVATSRINAFLLKEQKIPNAA